MDLALLYEVKFQFPDNNFDKLSNQKLLEAILYYSGDDK